VNTIPGKLRFLHTFAVLSTGKKTKKRTSQGVNRPLCENKPARDELAKKQTGKGTKAKGLLIKPANFQGPKLHKNFPKIFLTAALLWTLFLRIFSIPHYRSTPFSLKLHFLLDFPDDFHK